MKNPFTKNNIDTDHAVRKQFNYSNGEVKLNFTLRVDMKKELQVFKELLEKAVQDVGDEINKLG